MDALTGGGGGGTGGFWQWTHGHPFGDKKSSTRRNRNSKPSDSVDISRNTGYRFPFKQAVTAGSLALAGDTIAQLTERWRKGNNLTKNPLSGSVNNETKDTMQVLLSNHDWVRAVRMTSYGFLFYGPGSYAWYQFLDRTLPKQTVQNLMLKVLLNQIVLGPSVVAVVFAWNNLWRGKLSELPKKYQNDALPTLLYGFRFWIPVSLLNFWVVPLQARVAFMSSGSIFWNFCLSTTMNK